MNTTRKILVLTFALVLLGASSRDRTAVCAQEPHHSRISIVHPGFDALKADLKSVLDLTEPAEQEQWVDILDYIETFQIGIDGQNTVRVDVLTGMTPTAYLVWVPLAVPEDSSTGLADEFRESLDLFGYPTIRDPQERTLYKIEPEEGVQDSGWFHVLNDLKYGIFVLTTDNDDMRLLRQLILKAGDPSKDVAKLLAQKPSMGAELINAAQSEDDRDKRKTAFAELRKISMDTIQKRPTETSTEFNVREALMRHQLNELERLMVEAAEIQAVALLDRKGHKGALNIRASAIEGTSLQNTIQAFNAQPDAFADVARLSGSALSVRVNHPIDEMRQEHATEMVDLIRKDMDARILDDKELTDDQRKSINELLDGLVGLVKDGVKSGYVNAFVESVPLPDQTFTTVACISAPESTRLNTLLPLLKNAGADNTVEMNVAKAGDVDIHRVQLAEGFISIIDRFFGVKQDLFVGVTTGHVWMASGPDAQATMSSMITSLGEPRQHDVALHVEVNALPWARHLQEVAKKKGSDEDKTAEEKESRRSRERLRLRAIEAMSKANDDQMLLDVKVVDQLVDIQLTVDTGILRLAGKMIAAFSEENFGID